MERWWSILLGLFLMIVGAMANYYLTIMNLPVSVTISMQAIASGIIVVGAGTLILELPFIAKYFDVRLARLFSGSKFLSQVGEDKLREINMETTKRIYKTDEINDAQSLYNIVMKDIFPDLSKPYRTNYREIITMSLINKSYCKTEVEVSFDFVSPKANLKEWDYEYNLTGHIPSKKKFSNNELCVIESFKINDVDCMGKKKVEHMRDNDNRYHMRLIAPKVDISQPARIFFKLYFLEAYDVKNQFRTVPYPTRKAYFQLIFKDAKELNAQIFELIHRPPNFPRTQTGSIIIETDRWLLPGHGVIFTWLI